MAARTLKRLAEVTAGTPPPMYSAAWDAAMARIEALEQQVLELRSKGAGAPLIIVARSTAAVAAAVDEDTPTRGTATRRVFNGTKFVNGGPIDYWNMATGSTGGVAANKPLQLARIDDHFPVANWEQC